MKSFKQFFYESIRFMDKSRDIIDDVSDEKIGEEPYKEFDVTFDDGGRAYGRIIDRVAYISGINSPKLDVLTPKRGTKTYQRVLKLLYQNGINTIKISLQSKDSRHALHNLLKRNVLINPREITGNSMDEHPTKFDINPDLLVLEYRHNLADGTPSQSIQAHNGKDPNRIGPNKKHLGYVPEYQALNPKAHVLGAIFAGQELANLMNDYNFTNYDTGTVHKIKNSPFALEMYADQNGQPAGRIIKTK